MTRRRNSIPPLSGRNMPGSGWIVCWPHTVAVQPRPAAGADQGRRGAGRRCRGVGRLPQGPGRRNSGGRGARGGGRRARGRGDPAYHRVRGRPSAGDRQAGRPRRASGLRQPHRHPRQRLDRPLRRQPVRHRRRQAAGHRASPGQGYFGAAGGRQDRRARMRVCHSNSPPTASMAACNASISRWSGARSTSRRAASTRRSAAVPRIARGWRWCDRRLAATPSRITGRAGVSAGAGEPHAAATRDRPHPSNSRAHGACRPSAAW